MAQLTRTCRRNFETAIKSDRVPHRNLFQFRWCARVSDGAFGRHSKPSDEFMHPLRRRREGSDFYRQRAESHRPVFAGDQSQWAYLHRGADSVRSRDESRSLRATWRSKPSGSWKNPESYCGSRCLVARSKACEDDRLPEGASERFRAAMNVSVWAVSLSKCAQRDRPSRAEAPRDVKSGDRSDRAGLNN